MSMPHEFDRAIERIVTAVGSTLVGLIVSIALTQHCLAQTSGSPAADPQAVAGTWTPTGNLQVARNRHTATLLANGKVLVVGGFGSGNAYLASTELYDPATGAWGLVGSMNVPRVGHTATLLPNGKVLVVGGDTSTAPLDFGRTNTAELYDPATGTWSFTGSANGTLSGHTATLLHGGKVLVAGGYNTATVKTAELYDPVTGAWSPTGSLNVARYWHTATLLQDGRVLVARGSNDGDLADTLVSVEIYDPVAGTWNVTANAGAWSVFHSATLLPNGRVLVAGGNSGGIGGDDVWASAELYDPATQSWSATGNLATARYGHSATLLPSGEVLVVGGLNQEGRYPIPVKYNILSSVEKYDSNAGAWVSLDSLGAARAYHTATLLQNGQVLVVGGSVVGPDYGTAWSASAELYATAAPLSPYRITALFSDQAGVYQYVLLQSLGTPSGSVAGLTLTVSSGSGVVKQLIIPSLPAGSSVPLCIATHSVAPAVDAVIADGFLPTGGGTISLVGVDSWTFGALPTDGHSSLQRNNGVNATAVMQCSHFSAVLNVPIDPVVEYYNPALDHYFISASQPDLDALDSGRFPGWQRTGYTFPAWITRTVGPLGGFVVPAGLRDVCRIYIPPDKGDSHFFSVSAAECAASLAQHPDFVLETNAAFLATLPDAATGACPSGQVPVYRLWNNRVDSNHRYTTSLTTRGEMISRGYIAEGYGPNAVALCVGGNL